MSKRLICLPVLLCSLHFSQAQDNAPVASATGAVAALPSFTNASFISLITHVSQRANEQAITGKTPAVAHYDYYFREFATEHGVASTQVKGLVDKWVNTDSVKGAADDYMLQGARSYYLQQYSASSLYYEQAAGLHESDADAASYAYLLAGNSASEGADYTRAIFLYHLADSLLVLPDTAQRKRHLKDLQAVVLYEEGIRTPEEVGSILLNEAVKMEKNALALYTKDHFPEEWARTQCNLGTVLQELADRAEEDKIDGLLIESLTAFKASLDVYTQKDFPQDWARAYNNMGVVLSKLGDPEQAVSAFQAALQVYTKKDFPEDWALTQYNLGTMLQLQGGEVADNKAPALFEQSIAAYRQCLEIYTAQTAPAEWGWAQHNLGLSLCELGRRKQSVNVFNDAITAFKAALTVRDRDCASSAWANSQYNLGNAFWEAAGRSHGESMSLLEQAATAFKSSLQFYYRKDFGEEWFNAQNSLGMVYEQLQQWTAAINCFELLRDIEPVYTARKVNELRKKGGM